MRIFTLSFVFFCGLLPQILMAQDRLPAGLQHLRADLTPELATALDRLFPATTLEKTSRQPAKSLVAELVLDSTITYEAVDAGGGTTTNVPVSRSVITREGNLVTTRESTWEGGSWTPVSESRSFRDALDRDRLQVLVAWDEDAGTWVNTLRLETFYRGNSTELLDSLFIDLYDGTAADWQPFIHLTYSYDDQDRLLESVTASYFFSNTDPTRTVDTYKYNAEGENDEIVTGELEGNDTITSMLTRIAYENGQVTEFTTYYPDFDGENYEPADRITYTYTSEGLQDSIVTYLYDYDAEDWEEVSLENFDYDADGRLTDAYEIIYQVSGEPTISRQTFTYVSDTDYIQESESYEYDYDTEDYVLIESTTYFYSGDIASSTPPVATGTELKVWPNPAGDFLRIDFSEPAVLHLFNQSGKLITQRPYLPGDAINLAGLPSGIYFVSLTTRAAQHRVRVVKG